MACGAPAIIQESCCLKSRVNSVWPACDRWVETGQSALGRKRVSSDAEWRAPESRRGARHTCSDARDGPGSSSGRSSVVPRWKTERCGARGLGRWTGETFLH